MHPWFAKAIATKNGALPSPARQCTAILAGYWSMKVLFFSESEFFRTSNLSVFWGDCGELYNEAEDWSLLLKKKKSSTILSHLLNIYLEGSIPSGIIIS